jgi:hypothetical protein
MMVCLAGLDGDVMVAPDIMDSDVVMLVMGEVKSSWCEKDETKKHTINQTKCHLNQPRLLSNVPKLARSLNRTLYRQRETTLQRTAADRPTRLRK